MPTHRLLAICVVALMRLSWRLIAVAGVIAGLLVGPSAALASSAWSAPTPVDSPSFSAQEVSCPSASFCAAVASDGRAISGMTFNGSSWSTPVKIYDNPGSCSPASACANNHVSCASASFCVAVDGHFGNALTFNGSSWGTPTQIDDVGGSSYLESVSCPSPSFCAAVDARFIAPGEYQGYVLTFNGSSWSTPEKIDNFNGLRSVSCASSSFCAAVDGSGDALTFNGLSSPFGGDPPVRLPRSPC
jgi:hypothetical protein